MSKIVKISSEDIALSLNDSTRQYLVGHLSRPQGLCHIEDENIEVGITSYREYKSEPAHFHPIVTEYQYVIMGNTKYIDLKSNEELEFKTGDFFMIPSGTPYAQKSTGGTVILFIKTPGGNDKTLTEVGEGVKKWQSDWEEKYDAANV